MFGAQTLIQGVDKEYLSCTLKFKTFGNMNKKLSLNMLFFFVNGLFGHIEKNQSFQKQEFEINFLDLYICRKL